ncbi:unnamed protein product [Pieris macdunnoughi]|uniref:Uncharacterized protein n=1 Tax=Pieris macdunnoughi TaxID=345717 RepID=A0A821RIF5_9NEOP|nr:unnamed protein product [Pieris macdunnoughi]
MDEVRAISCGRNSIGVIFSDEALLTSTLPSSGLVSFSIHLYSTVEHVFTRQSCDNPVEEKPSSDKSYVVGAWPATTPGHTGYLTVATLPPAFLRRKLPITEAENGKALSTEIEMKSDSDSEEDKLVVDESGL